MTKHDLTLTLDGLNCASCSGRAERALGGVDGTNDVSVNLATNRARLNIEPTAVPAALKALSAAGYPARLENAKFRIDGMTCASCVARIERSMIEMVGVTSVSVNLATKTANVTFLVGSVDRKELAAGIRATGYDAKLLEDGALAESDREEAEIQSYRKATLVAAASTAPVFLWEMGRHFVPGLADLLDGIVPVQVAWVVQWILISIVLVWPGRHFFRSGVPALLKRAPDMNSLVSLGTFAAWAYSTVAVFLPAVLPEGSRAVYLEAAGVIVTLILLGRWLEARARGRTGEAMRALMQLRPETALVFRNGSWKEVPTNTIAVSEKVRLRPGERVPIDGVVSSGESFIEESMLTGEAFPKAKAIGAQVYSGTVNGSGSLDIETTAVGTATVLSGIIKLVEDAQGAKLPIQSVVDRIVTWFVPLVLIVAAMSLFCWLVFAPGPALGLALVASVSVLIVACPCAMGLATPTSVMVGSGRAASAGILFRKGDALQTLSEVSVVAFDKTGTLTEGHPKIVDVHCADGIEENEAIRLAAAVEAHSEHPLGKAVLDEARVRGLSIPDANDFISKPGVGVFATVDGVKVSVGKQGHAEVQDEILAARAKKMAREAKTPAFVVKEGEVIAVLGIADQLKPSAVATVRHLQDAGFEVAMVTGDTQDTAAAFARQLGIRQIEAGVLPEGKVAALKRIKNGRLLAFVGDGINDAPALATADIGIAVGSGTDVALEAADVVLMSGDLTKVAQAIEISRLTMRNIRQNLFWAFAYNVALIPVAAGLLFPLWGITLSPMLAAGAMAVSSVFVVSNALRLRGPVVAGSA